MQTVGVIVARFQVPLLHEGHRYLIEYVAKRHRSVLIVLGVTPARLTRDDPLDFETRARMVADEYPDVTIRPLPNHPSDRAWSKNLDRLIARAFPGKRAILYGSRKSFASRYSGTLHIHDVPSIETESGTDVREGIIRTPEHSASFRRGIIYATAQRFPTSFQAVDVAVYRKETDEVLLGRKTTDGSGWRFIGGFVDPTDASLEMAARREVYEEAGIEADAFRYAGSARIDDWRYRGREDSVLSTLFIASYIFGKAIPGDDIADVRWFKRDRVERVLIPTHKPLGALLRAYFK